MKSKAKPCDGFSKLCMFPTVKTSDKLPKGLKVMEAETRLHKTTHISCSPLIATRNLLIKSESPHHDSLKQGDCQHNRETPLLHDGRSSGRLAETEKLSVKVFAKTMKKSEDLTIASWEAACRLSCSSGQGDGHEIRSR
jgi:hypothetical protein